MTTPAQPALAEVLAVVPPPAQAYSLDAKGVAKLISSRPCLLYGWSAANIAGAGAERCDIYDGQDVNGQLVTHMEIPTGDTLQQFGGPPGILCSRGIFVGNVGADVMAVVFAVIL